MSENSKQNNSDVYENTPTSINEPISGRNHSFALESPPINLWSRQGKLWILLCLLGSFFLFAILAIILFSLIAYWSFD